MKPDVAWDPRTLDDARPFEPSPALWTRNLEALSRHNHVLADKLRGLALPDHWRPVLGLDDAPTFRVEHPGEPARWLSNSAAPRTRARALVHEVEPTRKNAALPGIGAAGAELSELLLQRPRHLAVFVFETAEANIAAVLRLHDLAEAIDALRCILIDPRAERDALLGLLEREPGLVPPGEIVLPHLATPQRVAELRALCEESNRVALAQRAARLNQVAVAWETKRARSRTDGPRLALVSLSVSQAAHEAARRVEKAARQEGWPVLCNILDGPRWAHPVVHAESLAAFDPTVTIFVDHRPTLPVPPPGRSFVWALHGALRGQDAAREERPAQGPDATPPSVPDATLQRCPGATPVVLGASPDVLCELQRAGLEDAAPWFWACDPDTPRARADLASGAIVLVADAPPFLPQRYGIERREHLRLWEQLLAQARAAWETPLSLEPDKLLTRALQAAAVPPPDAEQRRAFTLLTQRTLIPGVAARQVARHLATAGQALHIVGHGWDASDATPGGAVVHADLAGVLARTTVAACIFTGQADPLGLPLLHAAAAGCPLILHDPGGRTLHRSLRDVLRVEQHFLAFSDLRGLSGTLQLLRREPARAIGRAERAFAHVRAEHSYGRRLHDLLTLPA